MKFVPCVQRVITEIMMGNETNEIIEELFESFLQKYQEVLEGKIREREFELIALIYCILVFIK